MQFVHTPYFSGYANASQQQALQQQQQPQQQQQQQQQNSPHASQSPAPSAAQVDQQHQQQPQPLGLPAALPGFAQAGIPVASAGTELNAQGKPKRKQVKNACGMLSLPFFLIIYLRHRNVIKNHFFILKL